MSEITETGTAPVDPAQSAEPQEGQEGQAAEAKTFTADYVEKLRKEAAKYRTEAKANSSAAQRLAEIEEASKTAEQKLAERAEAAEREAAAARREALRYRVAATHGVSDEDAELFLTGDDEETLIRQAERLTKRDAGDIRRDGAYVPSEGRTTTGPALNSDQLEQALRAKLGI